MTPQVCEYIFKMYHIQAHSSSSERKTCTNCIYYCTKKSFFNIISNNIVAFITIVTKTTSMPWFCTKQLFQQLVVELSYKRREKIPYLLQAMRTPQFRAHLHWAPASLAASAMWPNVTTHSKESSTLRRHNRIRWRCIWMNPLHSSRLFVSDQTKERKKVCEDGKEFVCDENERVLSSFCVYLG